MVLLAAVWVELGAAKRGTPSDWGSWLMRGVLQKFGEGGGEVDELVAIVAGCW